MKVIDHVCAHTCMCGQNHFLIIVVQEGRKSPVTFPTLFASLALSWFWVPILLPCILLNKPEHKKIRLHISCQEPRNYQSTSILIPLKMISSHFQILSHHLKYLLYRMLFWRARLYDCLNVHDNIVTKKDEAMDMNLTWNFFSSKYYLKFVIKSWE